MISGTSYDAIEAVAADLELAGDGDGTEIVADLRAHVSAPYSDELRAAIADMLPPAQTTIEQVCRLDTEIGLRFAEVAADVAEEAFAGAVDVVCSHGQTVFHWVEGNRARGTLQIGQPAFIAERTGATVVADVRARDVAAGGHGAPLASLLDVLLLAEGSGAVRGALNLGGISNMTVVGGGREPIAFDIGPAGALLDAVADWRSDGRESCDLDGRRAARGRIDQRLLDALLDEPYYRLAPPKSTGKELFNLAYLRERLGAAEIATDDLLATLVALTAETVAAELERFGVAEVIAAGGGTRNPVLMAAITERAPGVHFATIDAFGVAEAAKEALLMALIGFLTVHGLPATVPSCTGAARATVLGAVLPGSAGRAGSVGTRVTASGQPRRLVIRTPLAPAGGR
jgi:anhydro-N-acetylmuramic acid kinase